MVAANLYAFEVLPDYQNTEVLLQMAYLTGNGIIMTSNFIYHTTSLSFSG